MQLVVCRSYPPMSAENPTTRAREFVPVAASQYPRLLLQSLRPAEAEQRQTHRVSMATEMT